MEEVFGINNYNLIQDGEYYYFFRALNMEDNKDIEEGTTLNEKGEILRIRTDRERYEGNTKYSEDSKLSLEEIYDHIKMHYRKDTNCISLTTNSNVAINYGRASYKDKYIMVKIPKNEFGENVISAPQYMLKELYSKIEQALETLNENDKQEILDVFEKIEKAKEGKTLQDIIAKRYIGKKDETNPSKAHPRKGIKYSTPKARISSYQALDEEQLLEVNKIYAKLAILENKEILKHVIPHSSNSKLRETIGNAFSSTEVIHYGDIKQENILEIPKEVADIFSLIQQVNDIDRTKVEELKQALLVEIQNGKQIDEIPEINSQVKNNISIEELYEITDGKVEYGKANSIVNKMFYLSKSRQNAIELANVLDKILGENSEFEDVVQNIRKNGFRVEPEIISRQSGKGIKLSESVNLNLEKEEQELVSKIKELPEEELELILQNGGLYNASDIITSVYGETVENESIDKSRYYAEAIISKYNWQEIGIEEFRISERNELISRLEQRNCIELYNTLQKKGIEESKISTVLLNIVMREGLYKEYESGNIEEILNTRQDVLQNNLNTQVVEKFLGYHDIENTGLKLKNYQEPVYNKVNKIFEDKKFAQVILPTGAGKSFVVLYKMQEYVKEHPDEKMLYLAPQDEILNQIEKYIVNNIHGKKETVGKTEDEIIAEVFPNITFETYSGLLAKRGQEVIKDQYGMIVLDELHRTGAKEWEGKIDSLLKNQTEDVKVFGITATPTRDADGRDMANETAKKLGYTDEEIKQGMHLASNLTLKNAIRLGYVVNPKLVYCKYDLITSGKMDELRAKIDDIEDENKRIKELQKYKELRAKLNKEIDDEIGEEARKKLEEEARKNLDSGIGKEEILRQNVKKGGKYIVFIPVTDQGDIEDEDGNRIGTKTGEEKIIAYQEYLNKVFEGTDIVPELHSLLGSYSKEKNAEELDAFETDKSDRTKFMVVMNKANEGIHIDGVDGIIWFRALDENSKILYLQQLGRAIYSLDEDNPLPDEKRPIVIDLANNSLTVKMEKDFENMDPIDDLEAITIVTEWINEHDGIIPDRNSSNKQEQHYYAILRRIQEKYNKYLEGFDNSDDLTDEDKLRIEEIIELATSIDLWDMDLPPIPKTRGSKDEFDPFTVEGVLRDFVEFEEEVEKYIPNIGYLNNALKIEGWCKKNFGEKTIEERREPSSISKDEEEKRLGSALGSIRQKILKQYEGKKLEEIEDEEHRQIVKIIRRLDKEYGLSKSLKNTLIIEKWCKEKYGEKAIEERREPNSKSKNEEEKRLGRILSDLRRVILKQYEGKNLEEIEDEEHRQIVEIIRRLDKEYRISEYLKNALTIKKWCEEKYGEKGIEERREPSRTSKDKEEKRLGKALDSIRHYILKQYEGKKLEEIEDEEHRKIAEIIRRLDKEYGLSKPLKNTLIIKKWCEEKYGEKAIEERKEPSSTSKDEEEKRLGKALDSIRYNILKQYEGKKLEEIEDEEHRQIVEIIRRLDKEYRISEYLKNALTIKKWCEEKYEEKAIEERREPRQKSQDEEEKKLGKALATIRQDILKQYEGKKIEEIEDEEHRKIAEIIRRLDKEYGLSKSLKNTLKIKKWCEEKYGKKAIEERREPRQKSQDEEEKKLGKALATIRQNILKQYEGKKLEEIEDEEHRQIVEIIRALDKEYNPKIILKQSKQKRDDAKAVNEKAKELEEKVAEQLRKRGINNEEQSINFI